jgi:hypothetical protein
MQDRIQLTSRFNRSVSVLSTDTRMWSDSRQTDTSPTPFSPLLPCKVTSTRSTPAASSFSCGFAHTAAALELSEPDADAVLEGPSLSSRTSKKSLPCPWLSLPLQNIVRETSYVMYQVRVRCALHIKCDSVVYLAIRWNLFCEISGVRPEDWRAKANPLCLVCTIDLFYTRRAWGWAWVEGHGEGVMECDYSERS